MTSAANNNDPSSNNKHLKSFQKNLSNSSTDTFCHGILNALSAHICVVDAEGTITAINRSWTLFGQENGGDPQALNEGANYFTACLNASYRNGIHDAATALDGIKAVLTRQTELFEMEYDCHSPDEKRWFFMRVTPLEFQGPMAVVSHIEITAEKQAEEERVELKRHLLQMQKIESIGQLAGGVAHNFNNMLGVILGHAELALLKLDPDESIRHHLSEIQNSAKRSADLTKQLLAFARKQLVTPQVVDLNEPITKTINMLQPLMGENIHLNWIPGTALWSVKIDPSQVEQILTNLCINSRDALKGSGQITVKTDNCSIDAVDREKHKYLVPADYVRLSVKDEGVGIDQETLDHVFEPFYSTKAVGQGTGLGLAMVYGSVKQHNGYIEIHSEVGIGTEVEIFLPKIDDKQKVNKKTSPIGVQKGHETILVVEDEEMLLSIIKAFLEKFGYNVLSSSSADHALYLSEKYKDQIDLLISDLIMPEMNGKDLSEKLRIFRPEIKTLYISGHSDDIISEHGIVANEVPFLQKPFTYEDLNAKIREVLDLKT